MSIDDDVLMRRLITVNGPAGSVPIGKARELYEAGHITLIEFRIVAASWSKDANGKQFKYICPKCHAPMSHCPDPICQEEGVGHHLLEEDWEGCDADISYKTAMRYYKGEDEGKSKHYSGWCVYMNVLEKIKAELNEAVQAVLKKYATNDYPEGCEFHGELIGLIQQKDAPETAVGQYVKIGNGLPDAWIGPLPGKYRDEE
jgi:hypothetical protein